MSEDIVFCIHEECKNRKCERHFCQIKEWWLELSFMDLKNTEFCILQKVKPSGKGAE